MLNATGSAAAECQGIAACTALHDQVADTAEVKAAGGLKIIELDRCCSEGDNTAVVRDRRTAEVTGLINARRGCVTWRPDGSQRTPSAHEQRICPQHAIDGDSHTQITVDLDAVIRIAGVHQNWLGQRNAVAIGISRSRDAWNRNPGNSGRLLIGGHGDISERPIFCQGNDVVRTGAGHKEIVGIRSNCRIVGQLIEGGQISRTACFKIIIADKRGGRLWRIAVATDHGIA